MASTPNKAEVLWLFRSFLRTERRFFDYNVREYTKHRTIDGLHHSKSLSDRCHINSAFSDAKTQLDVARRQAVVCKLYTPKMISIMDLKSSSHSHQIS